MSAAPRMLGCHLGAKRAVCNGCAPCKGGVLRWVQIYRGRPETHAPQQNAIYSIVCSPRASSTGGTAKPGAFAAFWLVISPNPCHSAGLVESFALPWWWRGGGGATALDTTGSSMVRGVLSPTRRSRAIASTSFAAVPGHDAAQRVTSTSVGKLRSSHPKRRMTDVGFPSGADPLPLTLGCRRAPICPAAQSRPRSSSLPEPPSFNGARIAWRADGAHQRHRASACGAAGRCHGPTRLDCYRRPRGNSSTPNGKRNAFLQ